MSHYSSGTWFSWAKVARPRQNSSVFVRPAWKLSDTCKRWTLLKVNCNPWVSAVHPQKDNVIKSFGILKYELIISLISVFWQIQMSMSLYSCVVYPTVLVTGFMAGYTADLGCWSDVWIVQRVILFDMRGKSGLNQTSGFTWAVSYRIVTFFALGTAS